MIKINLLKEKEKKKPSIQPTAESLKGLDVSTFFKLDKSQYYLSALLWIGVLGMGFWYLKTSKDLTDIKREIDQLQAERSRLEAKAKQVLDEKKNIESEISALKAEMEAIDSSKDILIGLKALYEPFNKSFVSFSSSIPTVSWMLTYSQSLDIDNRKLKAEFDLHSFDYSSIGYYMNNLKSKNIEVSITSIERKTNQSGYEYYSTRLTTEKSVGGE